MANTIYSKDFSKKMFFEAVIAMAQECENEQVEACAAYELDKLAEASAKAAAKRGTSAGSTDRMCSDYAKQLAAKVLKVLDKTPKTAEQIVEALANDNINGKAIGLNPWLYSVLGALSGDGKSGATLTDEGRAAINPNGVAVKITMSKAQKTDSKGLIKEVLVKSYCVA